MRSRKDLARACAASGSSSAVSIASAKAPTIFGANSASVCGPKISGMPPTLAATIGISARGHDQELALRIPVARLDVADETHRVGQSQSFNLRLHGRHLLAVTGK